MRSLQFNQGFALDRTLIKGMLQYALTGEPTSNGAVGAYLGVNPYKVGGLRGWFCKLGLGSTTSKQYSLSPFGAIVAAHDPDLIRPGTHWLLHYFLSSEHDERSEVWHQCFNSFLQPGIHFSREELREHVERSQAENMSNKDGVKKDTNELLSTYSQEVALGSLNLITQQIDRKFVAGFSAATPPDPLIIAYVLFDVWKRHYNDSNTMRLSQLVSEPETLGRIFVATPTQVREFILHLQVQGLLTYADTQHEPVTRRFQDDPTTLLEQYYQRL